MKTNKYNQTRYGNTSLKNTSVYQQQVLAVVEYLDALKPGEDVNSKQASRITGLETRKVTEIIIDLYYAKKYPLDARTEHLKRIYSIKEAKDEPKINL